MNLEKEIIQIIEPYERERILMNIKEFDQLLKRVNLEEDTAIKTQILNIIDKYINLLTPTNEVTVSEISVPEIKVEKVEETVVSNIESEVEKVTVVEEPVEPEEEIQPLPAITEEPKDVVTPAEDKSEEIVKAEEGTPIDAESQVSATEVISEQIEETVEEVIEENKTVVLDTAAAVEELAKEQTEVEVAKVEKVEKAEDVDHNQYVENFGLVSPTNDEHLKQIIERGGVMFREKRSFMLTLCLDDEVIAIGKTIKLEQFPQNIQEHMKKGGFISVKVLSFGEIVKKSRARYVDVTYTDLQLLENNHWIVQNVTNLLEKGEIPEHVKQKEKEEALKQIEATAETKETTETKVAQEEKPFVITSFMINPSFVETFRTQKEAVKSLNYGISSKDGIARLMTTNSQGTVVIGINQNSQLKPNNYVAKIVDYSLKEKDGNTFAQFKLNADIMEKTEKPASDSSAQQHVAKQETSASTTEGPSTSNPVKANINVQTKGDVPADFPLVDELTLTLYPKAEAMFQPAQVTAMKGQAMTLGFITDEKGARVSLTYDVFEMATSANVLTHNEIRNSKWLARVTEASVVEQEKGKALRIKFDYLMEMDKFPTEAKDDVCDITKFVPITDEAFASRQREKNSDKPATTEPKQEKKEQPKQEDTTEKVSAEKLLNKEVTPEEAKELLNPHPEADYKEGYDELVASKSKDMGGAMQEIRNKTALTQQDRQQVTEQAQGIISGVIAKTLTDTGIHTQTQEPTQTQSQTQVQTLTKQTTQVMGNLQDGAGNLSETETVINFATGYPPQSWAKSVGKQIHLNSQIQFGGQVTMKNVQMVGNNGAVVAQGQVSMNEALLVDGNQHNATLLGIENAVQEQQGYIISLRLGNFQKVA